ncbi:hypothetical protein DU472_03410 [Campylobacter novaezeelandiae]|uniref:Uncharacterized protein n=1 Tax=Campylobacter novaezeelandiae TaxID=2267891 RepID=A0A4Q9JTB6_9BACT|nr:putative membrane protein [Campylobacter novaezeelandiae]TBR78127.1 hypothetical protein DU474_07340 [Campylobacter novaezeelandiae]TBR78412.1 hypothetical protein DU474_05770 [Campylobacter novaezeelandiae]TBR79935.1 hypothetical protein DU473_06405 [Campylobacter novaezeelandiae]TBR81372.1 hypothetical protein DU472_03410 [Campylobacter novaezeelandiae]
MIYLFDFLKGVSLGFIFFGTLFLFSNNYFIWNFILFGILLYLIFTLLIKNYELKQKIKNSQI